MISVKYIAHFDGTLGAAAISESQYRDIKRAVETGRLGNLLVSNARGTFFVPMQAINYIEVSC